MLPLLQVSALNVDFFVKRTRVSVLNDVSFDVREGEVLAIIGETGCGKSVTGNAVLHVLPENAHASGSIKLDGVEVLSLAEKEFRKLRGKDVMSIPQSPATSLDPLMPVGSQVAECVTRRFGAPPAAGKQVKAEVCDIFSELELPGGEASWGTYACELSGGMCQRVLISMGIITHPRLLVVDEPTKAVDWSLRKNVAELLERLNQEKGCTLLVITHDIPFARRIADRIAVMYAGEIVELGGAQDVIDRPLHPYTEGLIGSSPAHGFRIMPGHMPSFEELPTGCRFSARCPYRDEQCADHPSIQDAVGERQSRCWHPLQGTEAAYA